MNLSVTPLRIEEGFVEPTLKEAVPGNLSLVLSYSTMKSIIEMIQALDVVTPGIASEHTLLYGLEAKFYSSGPLLNNAFVTEIGGLYAGGDGAGITRGLAQAGACGIAIARDIESKLSDTILHLLAWKCIVIKPSEIPSYKEGHFYLATFFVSRI